MDFSFWSVTIGALLIGMALTGALWRRLPLSTSMLYLAAGVALSPLGFDVLRLDPIEQSASLERIAEVAVLVSLFVTGLKLSAPLADVRWYLSLRLALGAMVLTVAAIAVVGMTFLGLSVGAAILLGAILAPTDPVLASDVQVADTEDRDRVRFTLTGEGGLNDGMAFPFVMLGLGLLGLHDLGPAGIRWVAVDVAWSIAGGLAIGALAGFLVGKLVLLLRVRHQEAVGYEEFLALGLIALSYGIALLAHTYGFLAVFAAGLALRRVEDAPTPSIDSLSAVVTAKTPGTPETVDELATDPRHATNYLTHAVLAFNEQLERIVEVALVLIIGAMLAFTIASPAIWWFVPLLLLAIRPVCVLLSLAGSATSRHQRALLSWFGIRGIGSIYYLMYAINHGLTAEMTRQFIALTLAVVVASIVVHGISVTPLMEHYARRKQRSKADAN
ncbi:MAG: cation:proton antiporter [Casimicrobiaceae bacterium]